MRLSDILDNTGYHIINGNIDSEIKDIVYDSRKANKDNVFVALVGAFADGHNYINKAYEQGCRNFIVCKDIDCLEDMNVIKVKNTRQALGFYAANFFGHPERDLIKIGITGTKGKTTTSFMIKSIFENAGYKIGVIGTMGIFIGEDHYPTVNTTPESYEVYKYLRKMVDEGCTHLVMEVSSLALKHGRVNGLIFDYSIYTNLYPDHISEHEHADFDEYKYFKSLLFSLSVKAIGNIDDPYSLYMLDKADNYILTGKDEKSMFVPKDIFYVNEKGKVGTVFSINDKKRNNTFNVFLGMPGEFNIYNALNAIVVALEENIEINKIQKALSEFKVKGRLEPVNISNDFSILIDYAHNGISLKSILEVMRQYPHKRIISVFGGCGERDKGRRYEMGEYSGLLADFTVVTEDNSKVESFESISSDIVVGINKTGGKYIVIEDRAKAIEYCLDNAQKGDVILLLGKGHETYMERLGVKVPFDEREVIYNWVKKQSNC